MPEDLSDSLRHPDLYFGYDHDTIYDRLNEKGISWRIYHGDIPQSLVLTHQRTAQNAKRYELMDVFYSDAKGPEGNFPAYCFIEPSYYWPNQNDDHPPHTTIRAQALLANVYNALRANDALWTSTLLVVLYDEHGGFHDHVSPPKGVPPDDHTLPNFGFDRLGVRVPALLISPWIERTIIDTEFDHTSLLKYLTEKWGLRPLTERVSKAQSFGDFIRTNGDPRSDTPVSLAPSAPETLIGLAADEPLNCHQKALIAFSEHLERAIDEPVGKPARAAVILSGALSQVETAKKRVEMFLNQQKAKAGQKLAGPN